MPIAPSYFEEIPELDEMSEEQIKLGREIIEMDEKHRFKP